ncbi:MAG: response regulator [bacterium]|nr:MAG: response regulator [bacterium]
MIKKKANGRPAIILLAEDNPADQQITKRVLRHVKVQTELHIVEDGVELMNYLRREDKYSDPKSSQRPDLILLDINMPRMDGKKALRNIKGDSSLKAIPVVMLTTSNQDHDILESYDIGVNSYITKPSDNNEFIKVIKSIEDFWLVVSELPSIDG